MFCFFSLSAGDCFHKLRKNIHITTKQWSNKNRTDTFFGFNWKKKLKILGLYFCSYKCASHIDENWSERIVKIKRLISFWEKRNLSVVGKIRIIKTFLISQVVYVMQALAVPEKVLIKMNRLLFIFLWRQKDCNRRAFEKVKRSVLCADVGSGGLNMGYL